MAVVKANGYGHGILQVSRTALDAGATYLGVATVKEGVDLRDNGITAPILVLSPIFEEEYDEALLGDLAVTVFTYDDCKRLSQIATELNKTATIHIKVDTGMNRVGYKANHPTCDITSIATEIASVTTLPSINLEGIYSHFASSGSDREFSAQQYNYFTQILQQLKTLDINIKITHISNSGGILHHPEYNLDMVRCGIILFGMCPESTLEGATALEAMGFRPALSLHSRIAQIKTIKKGESVGYSRNFVAQEDTVVATVTLGYADGITRHLSNVGKVIINDKICNIIGNICMDQFMVDATGTDAQAGNKVTLIGSDKTKRVSMETLADLAGTINYEIATSLSLRIPTYYKP